MIRTAWSAVLIIVAVVSGQNTDQSSSVSPCPEIFKYEQKEEGKWYGSVNLTTDIVLHGLWLNIVLDSKADILGNWIGEVSTKDNIDFKVQNLVIKINPGPPLGVRFFVQYNPANKPPALKAIRLNGKEICNINSQSAEVPLGIPDAPSKLNSWQAAGKPEKGKPTVQVIKAKPGNGNRNASSLSEDKKTDARARTAPAVATGSGSNFNKESNPNVRQGQSDDFLYNRPPAENKFTPEKRRFDDNIVLATTTRRSLDAESSDYDDDDEYIGGIPTIYIPGNLEKTSKKVQCGKVIFNSSRSDGAENDNGVESLEGQFPWQIALYHNQRSGENKYICGGTLVSHRHVVTAAHCVTRRGGRKIVNRNTLTLYLGKHNLRTSVDGVQIKFVGKITVHPEYNATTFSRDIAILQLKEPVTYTDHVLPICLWPDGLLDLSSVIGKHGSMVGWGFEDSGATKQELSLVKMPVVDTDTCIKSYNAYFARILSEYSYCATYAEGTSVCNGDSGGGMVFKSNDTWYMRGVASLSVAKQDQYRCDPDHFVIFTDVARFLPWIKENTYDY